MVDEGKKISFGFTKFIRKPVLKNTAPAQEKKVDYIECIESKTIRVIGGDVNNENKEEPHVIKLIRKNERHEKITNKMKANLLHNSKKVVAKANSTEVIPDVKIKQEDSLQDQAVRDILNDLKSVQTIGEQKPSLLSIENKSEKNELSEPEESTMDDYAGCPVECFGLAMLRGMGWKESQQNDKNKRPVEDFALKVRPPGMALGADKNFAAEKAKMLSKKKDEEEDLPLLKGSYVQLLKGKKYGQVLGFDDNALRVIIKLTLGGETISANEGSFHVVSENEYSKNSQVLNVKEYEDYKNNEHSSPKGRESRKRSKH